jgi:hypothetical protein
MGWSWCRKVMSLLPVRFCSASSWRSLREVRITASLSAGLLQALALVSCLFSRARVMHPVVVLSFIQITRRSANTWWYSTMSEGQSSPMPFAETTANSQLVVCFIQQGLPLTSSCMSSERLSVGRADVERCIVIGKSCPCTVVVNACAKNDA